MPLATERISPLVSIITTHILRKVGPWWVLLHVTVRPLCLIPIHRINLNFISRSNFLDLSRRRRRRRSQSLFAVVSVIKSSRSSNAAITAVIDSILYCGAGIYNAERFEWNRTNCGFEIVRGWNNWWTIGITETPYNRWLTLPNPGDSVGNMRPTKLKIWCLYAGQNRKNPGSNRCWCTNQKDDSFSEKVPLPTPPPLFFIPLLIPSSIVALSLSFHSKSVAKKKSLDLHLQDCNKIANWKLSQFQKAFKMEAQPQPSLFSLGLRPKKRHKGKNESGWVDGAIFSTFLLLTTMDNYI